MLDAPIIDETGYVNCPHCGRRFADPNATRVYCSYKCRRKATRRLLPPNATCLVCQAPIHRQHSRQRFCSEPCAKQFQREQARTGPLRPTGDNSLKVAAQHAIERESRKDLSPTEIARRIALETERKKYRRMIFGSTIDPWDGYRSPLSDVV